MTFGLLLVRLVVGLTMAAHGAQKLFGWFGGYGLDGTGQFLEGVGFHPGRRHALTAGLVEAVGGAFLVLGLLTPIASALIVSVMIVAVATVHLKNGFFAAAGGYEFNLVLAAAALAIAFTGPGAASLDALFGFPFADASWGVIALAVAVAGAAGQLLQRHQLVAQPASAH